MLIFNIFKIYYISLTIAQKNKINKPGILKLEKKKLKNQKSNILVSNFFQPAKRNGKMDQVVIPLKHHLHPARILWYDG